MGESVLRIFSCFFAEPFAGYIFFSVSLSLNDVVHVFTLYVATMYNILKPTS